MWLFNEHLWVLRRAIDKWIQLPDYSAAFPFSIGHAEDTTDSDSERQGLVTSSRGVSKWAAPTVLAALFFTWNVYGSFLFVFINLLEIMDRHQINFFLMTSILSLCFMLHYSACRTSAIGLHASSVKSLVFFGSVMAFVPTAFYYFSPGLTSFSVMITMKAFGYGFLAVPILTLVGYYHQLNADPKGTSFLWITHSMGTAMLPIMIVTITNHVGYEGSILIMCCVDFVSCILSVLLVSRTWFVYKDLSRDEYAAISEVSPCEKPYKIVYQKTVILFAYALSRRMGLCQIRDLLNGHQNPPIPSLSAQSPDTPDIIKSLEELKAIPPPTPSPTCPKEKSPKSPSVFAKIFKTYAVFVFQAPYDSSWFYEFGSAAAMFGLGALRICLIQVILFPTLCVKLGASHFYAATLLSIMICSYAMSKLAYSHLVQRRNIISARFVLWTSSCAMALISHHCELYDTLAKQIVFAVCIGVFGMSSLALTTSHLSEFARGRSLAPIISGTNLVGHIVLCVLLPFLGFFMSFDDNIKKGYQFVGLFYLVGALFFFVSWLLQNIGCIASCVRRRFRSGRVIIPDAVINEELRERSSNEYEAL